MLFFIKLTNLLTKYLDYIILIVFKFLYYYFFISVKSLKYNTASSIYIYKI